MTQRTVTAPWLSEGPVARLLALLAAGGEEARVVGGAVRNELLGEPVADIDIATTATPDEVVRRAEAAGLKTAATGIEHGTVTVIVDGKPFEVTTLREDVETFGRRATVKFGRDWKRDAERRDFTMNALSLSADGTLHDEIGGLPDLEARRVRFIGEARKRIAEDYLRVLRFFRFHAAYGHGAPDPEALHACIRGRDGLALLSRERVRTEMFKLVVAPHAVPSLAAMAETGLLVSLLGGVPLLASFVNMSKVEAAANLAPDPVRRLTALAIVVAEDAERLWQKLRLANVEYERMRTMARGWWRVRPLADIHDARILLYRVKAEAYTDLALLAWARSQDSAGDEAWRAFATLPQSFRPPVFPLRGADFVKRGIRPGEALGAALREAEALWLDQQFPNDDARLAAIADAVAAKPLG